MADEHWLLLIIGLLYVAECGVWVRFDATAFLALVGVRFRARAARTLPGNKLGGFALANPLPPLGSVFVCQSPPLALAERALVSYATDSGSPFALPAVDVRLLTLDRPHVVELDRKAVLVDGQPFVRGATTGGAKALSRLVRRVLDTPEEERGALADRWVDELFDTGAIAARVAAWRVVVEPLRVLAIVAFVYLLVFTPLLIWRFGVADHWIRLLVGWGVLLSGVLWTWPRAHTALYPELRGERNLQLFTFLSTPLEVPRAADRLARGLLDGRHPLAVAAVLLDPVRFRAVAEHTLRELRFPTVPPVGSDEEEAHAAAASWRARLVVATERLLRDRDLDPEALLAPPPSESPDCLAYCPRCTAQSVRATGECPDCRGVSLVPLVDALRHTR